MVLLAKLNIVSLPTLFFFIIYLVSSCNMGTYDPELVEFKYAALQDQVFCFTSDGNGFLLHNRIDEIVQKDSYNFTQIPLISDDQQPPTNPNFQHVVKYKNEVKWLGSEEKPVQINNDYKLFTHQIRIHNIDKIGNGKGQTVRTTLFPTPSPIWLVWLEYLFSTIIIGFFGYMIYRMRTKQAQQKGEIISMDMNNDFVKEVYSIILENLPNHKVTNSYLSVAVGLSQPQLYRKVKTLTGKSPGQFIRTLKLKKAKELLENSSITIAEVAYDCGFSEPAHFTRTFVNFFGMTPSAFRANFGK